MLLNRRSRFISHCSEAFVIAVHSQRVAKKKKKQGQIDGVCTYYGIIAREE